MVKKICILGSGLVSGSVVSFFCHDQDREQFSIVVGSKVPSELEWLSKKFPIIKTQVLDVNTEPTILTKIIKGSDVVISLLTNDMQVPIAKKCIELKVSMVHASYCTKEMRELHDLAVESGVTILNEIGLDPGIDHFLAMKAIDEIHAEEGSKVTGFVSYCGGLPEPKISNCNPLRYKFSWSPRTALGNMLNPAKFLHENKVTEMPSGGCLISSIKDVEFLPELDLEGYPNRDSLVYKEMYGIPNAVHVIRGTLRYRGFRIAIKALHKLNLLSSESIFSSKDLDGSLQSWMDVITMLLEMEKAASIPMPTLESVKAFLIHHGFNEAEIVALDDLGILSERKELSLCDKPLDILAEYLKTKLSFEANERDIVIMRHEIQSTNVRGDKEIREIEFLMYGDQPNANGGFSAMSKAVGLCIGHAANLLLNGTISRKGVIMPFTPDIYGPMLELLENDGLVFTERKSIVR